MPKIPEFASEEEESEFWDTHSAADYLDQTTPVDVIFVDARKPKVPISLRLDATTIARLKRVAEQRGMGYQTLIRMWVLERLAAEASNPEAARAPGGGSEGSRQRG